MTNKVKFPYNSFLALINEKIELINVEIDKIQDLLITNTETYLRSLIEKVLLLDDISKVKIQAKVDFLNYLIDILNEYNLGPIPKTVYDELNLSVKLELFCNSILPFDETTPWHKLYKIYTLHEFVFMQSIDEFDNHRKIINELFFRLNNVIVSLSKIKQTLRLALDLQKVES